MDRIKKALRKLTTKERKKLKKILQQINVGNFQRLDVKRLKKKSNIFRVRKESMRIIFQKNKNFIKVLVIERRTGKTYKRH